jgi:hypothetical protein
MRRLENMECYHLHSTYLKKPDMQKKKKTDTGWIFRFNLAGWLSLFYSFEFSAGAYEEPRL